MLKKKVEVLRRDKRVTLLGAIEKEREEKKRKHERKEKNRKTALKGSKGAKTFDLLSIRRLLAAKMRLISRFLGGPFSAIQLRAYSVQRLR